MRCAGLTDAGKKREKNEDAYYANADEGIYIVADGMGGHQAGEVASQLAVEKIVNSVRKVQPDYDPEGEFLRDAIMEAHRAVHEAAQSEETRWGMGTTLVLGYISPDYEQLLLSHVGDSRAYLFRDKKLQQLTTDHTVARRSSGGGVDTKPLHQEPSQHVLSQAVGRGKMLAPSKGEVSLEEGDRLLLCTDGLTNGVPEIKIIEVLSSTASLQEICQQLVDLANQLDGSDNVTVLLIDL